MKAITNTKLTMAPLAMIMGAALIVGSLVTNPARAADFSGFAEGARARVMQEATSQPGPAERVRRLKKSLEGARIVATLPDAGEQRERALAAIQREQLANFHAGAPVALEQAMAGASLMVRAPTPRTEQAIAAIQAEQLQAMQLRSLRQLAASMAHGPVMTRVADASGPESWNMP